MPSIVLKYQAHDPNITVS